MRRRDHPHRHPAEAAEAALERRKGPQTGVGLGAFSRGARAEQEGSTLSLADYVQVPYVPDEVFGPPSHCSPSYISTCHQTVCPYQ